jgi:ribonuclease HII
MERFIIGIDEVGRGPLLGPVAVGLCAIEEGEYERLKQEELFWEGKDSKLLTKKRRLESFAVMNKLKNEGKINFGVFFESNKVIDEFGIIVALQRAIKKGLANFCGQEPEAVDQIEGDCSELSGPDKVKPLIRPENCRVLLDGGLRAPKAFLDQITIVRGDQSELIISLASIAAKVTRDALLTDWAKKIEHYDLAENKGYGTARHLADLKSYGPCALHRRTFLRRFIDKTK